MLSVIVVAGLHAEARAEVVGALLRSVPGSLCLHHDPVAAPGGALLRTVRDAGGLRREERVEGADACACCAVRADLVPELERLADDRHCRWVVVELWDSVEPQAIVESLHAHAGGAFSLAGVVTAVDPALVEACLANGDDLRKAGLAVAPDDQRTVADTFARQVEYPAVLALVAGAEPAHAADLALLAQLHPTARLTGVDDHDFVEALTRGLDVPAAGARLHPACALLPQETERHGVATVVWRARRPFHPERLYAALEEVTCAAVRSRGRFWLAGHQDTLLAWSAAGGVLSVDPVGPWMAALPDAAWDLMSAERRVAASLDWHPHHGDRCQHLVFVSPDLDAPALRARLDACLLYDAEYAGGPRLWSTYVSAFDVLLGAAA